MKNWKLRLAALALSFSLAWSAAVPVMAAEISVDAGNGGKTGLVDNLLDVPVIGDLLRLFVGDESVQTAETATSETATGESATAETGQTPEPSATPAPTPEATPVPSATPAPTVTPSPENTVQPTATPVPGGEGQQTPVPTPEVTAAPSATPAPAQAVLTETQWGAVTLYSGTMLRASSREETNFGDLVTDAMVYAVRSSDRYRQDQTLAALPLVAAVNGGRFQGALEAGTTLSSESLQPVLHDGTLALVTVTPAKLQEILNAGLVGMLDSNSERFGNFLQVSGLRFVYQTSNNETTVKQAWLTDPDGGNARELNLNDTSSRIALVLPADLLEFYGLTAASGYSDVLSGAELSLYGAVTELPAHCDAATLAALMARGGSQGRILPVSASNYSAMLLSDLSNANRVANCLVDGKAVQGYTDANGSLILDNLSAGSHTVRMKAGEPAYYVSNITYVGTATGMVVMINIPADCLGAATVTATPAPASPAPASAAPTPSQEQGDTHPDIGPAIAAGTWGQDDNAVSTATPAPAAQAPAVTAAPAKGGSGTKATATPNPIQDPTAGTILGATPVPTLEPTPTPSPTPEPTPDPEEVAKQQQLEQSSSRIPLYVGCGLVVVFVIVVAVLFIRRRMEETKHETYRKRK